MQTQTLTEPVRTTSDQSAALAVLLGAHFPHMLFVSPPRLITLEWRGGQLA